VTLTGAYAYSHFRFRDFVNGGVQFAGKTIPGIPEQQWQAAATWHVPRALLVADVQSKSQVFVNDANAAAAPSFAVVDARVVGIAAFGKPWLSPVVGVQNLFDRKYIGSVAINATGASLAATKFYEPSPRRTWIIGLSAATNPW
jgi:iron complex outermembrane receptor protein